MGMVPIQGELDQQLSMVESSLPKLPMQMDSEKPRSYLPKMPCRTATYYPQAPLPNADSLEYYLRLAPETLFFTFYYMEVSWNWERLSSATRFRDLVHNCSRRRR